MTRDSGPLTADAILTATEEVLRRHGPAKATVVDVAQALGVSHTAVYRHFPSKAALREAVTRRWLTRDRDILAAIAADQALAPPQRLRAWLTALFAGKRAKAQADLELFAVYRILAAEHSATAAEHVADLLSQLTTIVDDGLADGSLAGADPAETARAVFAATARFHDPGYAAGWPDSGTEAEFGAVCDLLQHGLLPRSG